MQHIQFKFIGAVLAAFVIPTITNAATISGSITGPDIGTPIDGAQVVLYDTDFRFIVATTNTDSMGNYSFTIATDGSESSGNLLVEAAATGFAGGRHNSALPLNCFFGCAGDGSGLVEDDGLLVVADSDMLTGIDINLQAGAVFSGQVNDANTSAGLDGVAVRIVNDVGIEFVGFDTFSNVSGDFQFSFGVAAGNYTLLARDDLGGRVTQANNFVDCESGACPLVHRTPIPVLDSTPIGGLNFELRPGASISGQVQEAPGVPISSNVVVRLYSPSGQRVINTAFVASGVGDYSFNGLEGGSYFLEYDPFPTTSTNFIRTLHNGEFCPFSGCNRNSGVPFNLTTGTSVTNLNIVLPTGGKIGGTIVDASTMMPIPQEPDSFIVGLTIVDAAGVVLGGGLITDSATGTWVSGDGLPPGNYFVRTGSDFNGYPVGQSYDGFVDQILGGSDCEGLVCDFTGATPIIVGSGATTTGADILLNTGSSIEGMVIDGTTSDALTNLTFVMVYNDTGTLIGQDQVQADGSFRFSALPAGNYFIRTQVAGQTFPGISNINGNPYFDRVFGLATDCAGELCLVTDGTTITLDGTNDVSGINLELNSGPTVSGSIINGTTGLAVFGNVIITTDSGEFVNRYRVNPNTGRFTTGGLPAGMYVLTSDVSDAFVDTGAAAAPSNTFGNGGSGLTFTITDQDITDLNLRAVEIYIHGSGFEAL